MDFYYNQDGTMSFLEDSFPDYYQPAFTSSHTHLAGTPQIPQVASNYTLSDWSFHEDEPIRQTFFEGPKKCDCCVNWVEKQPVQMPEHAKKKYDKAAVVLFNKKDHKAEKAVVGGLIAMKSYLVEIQSPVLVELLRPLLRDLGTLVGEGERITIHAPFRDLFFAYPKITAERDELEPHDRKRKHIDILVELMDELFSQMSSHVSELHSKKLITWEYIWTIFPKNIIVYSKRHGHDRLFKVSGISGGSRNSQPWVLSCEYCLFNGTSFGKVSLQIRIPYFNGVRPISSLPVYPIGFHEDPNLETKIFQRSRKILNFQNILHCEHEGTAILASRGYSIVEQGSIYDTIDSDDDGPNYRFNVQRRRVLGRVVIDAFGMGSLVPDKSIEVQPIEPELKDLDSRNENTSIGMDLPLSHLDAHNKRRPLLAEQRKARDIMLENHKLLLILSPLLPGYSLRLNEWYWFSVDRLRPIKWSTSSFEQLVLAQEYKTLLLNCVKNHTLASKLSDDIIAGKGQGLVVLLSGPSGTGKTLTAEALAEVTKRPLLRLQASSFLRGSAVRPLLEGVFELSEEWNALMLVDEADDFISERALVETTSSEVASGILRSIEYFRGVIFFTANLYLDLDEAFRSRVHIHLRYNTLTFGSRRKLWETFIRLLKVKALPTTSSTASGEGSTVEGMLVNMSEREWNELAKWNLNGREIKNVAKTVYLRCLSNQQDLTYETLVDGIGITSPDAQRIDSREEQTPAPDVADEAEVSEATDVNVHSNPAENPLKRRRTDDRSETNA